MPLAELERASADRVAIKLRAHLLDGLRRREYRVLVGDELLDLGNYASASGHGTLTSGGKPGIPRLAVPHWRGRWTVAFSRATDTGSRFLRTSSDQCWNADH